MSLYIPASRRKSHAWCPRVMPLWIYLGGFANPMSLNWNRYPVAYRWTKWVVNCLRYSLSLRLHISPEITRASSKIEPGVLNTHPRWTSTVKRRYYDLIPNTSNSAIAWMNAFCYWNAYKICYISLYVYHITRMGNLWSAPSSLKHVQTKRLFEWNFLLLIFTKKNLQIYII